MFMQLSRLWITIRHVPAQVFLLCISVVFLSYFIFVAPLHSICRPHSYLPTHQVMIVAYLGCQYHPAQICQSAHCLKRITRPANGFAFQIIRQPARCPPSFLGQPGQALHHHWSLSTPRLLFGHAQRLQAHYHQWQLNTLFSHR